LSTTPGNMDCIVADGTNAKLQLSNMRFGPAARYHIASAHGASVYLFDNFWIEGGANAVAHIDGSLTANILIATVPQYIYYPTLTVLGPVSFSDAFTTSSALGVVTLAYRPNGIVAGASYVSGRQYSAILNGVIINLNGPPPVLPFPGNLPGSTGSGGQYSSG